MTRTITLTTENLKDLLNNAQKYKYFDINASDNNTDGEGVWHCDIEFYNVLENPEDVYSFDELKESIKGDYDYNDSVCLTAEEHIKELTKQLKYNVATLSIEELGESGFIIEEYGRILQKLAEDYQGGELLTINYFEGMNAFIIKEGM